MNGPWTQYVQSIEREPHVERRRRILAAHPEVRQLFGIDRTSFVFIVALLAAQFFLAYLLRDAPLWMVVASGFLVGAFIAHGLFVLAHEAAHNLVFRSGTANKLAGVMANLALPVPSALGFRSYHLLHHQYMGEPALDPDLIGPGEAAFFGRRPLGKALWFASFMFVTGLSRPLRVRHFKLHDPWIALNVAAVLASDALVLVHLGWSSFLFLLTSLWFAIGLHPLGGRWIQEHVVVHGSQETYSYYGPLNRFAFNIGFHTEHHDFMMIPWSRLPMLRRIAPEFYDGQYAHYSWTRTILRFIFSPELSLFSKVVRPNRSLQRPLARHAERNLAEPEIANDEAIEDARAASPQSSVLAEGSSATQEPAVETARRVKP